MVQPKVNLGLLYYWMACYGVYHRGALSPNRAILSTQNRLLETGLILSAGLGWFPPLANARYARLVHPEYRPQNKRTEAPASKR